MKGRLCVLRPLPPPLIGVKATGEVLDRLEVVSSCGTYLQVSGVLLAETKSFASGANVTETA